MFRPSGDPSMFLRPIYAIGLDLFALPMTPDTLALLAIIFDVFAILGGHFAVPSMFCDLLSIFSGLLRFLSISGTHMSTHRDPQHSTSIFEPNRPHTSKIRSEPRHTSHIAPNTHYITMPARFDRLAPRFDPNRPRELRRYFADLAEYLTQANVEEEQEKKRYACRYIEIDTEELWTSLLEYSDRAKSFSDFVLAIYRLYPGSDGQRQWLVADMERLVEERCRIGIRTLGDLGDYYRRFIVITTFLCGRNRLSDVEQSRAFIQGLTSDLCDRVLWRLQLKFPDHLSDDVYRLADIFDAAQFVLHGTSTSVSITSTLCDPLIGSASPDIAKYRTSSHKVLNHRSPLLKVVEHCIASSEVAEHRIASSEVASHCMTSPKVASHFATSPDTAKYRTSSHEVVNHCSPSPKVTEHRIGSPEVTEHRPSSSEVASHRITS